MKHIAIIYGTRPQVIKLAPLVKELDKHGDKLTYTLFNTGQHYDHNMDGVFHEQLGIGKFYKTRDKGVDITKYLPPYRLHLMIAWSADHLLEHKPDLVIVIGDTDSTLAGALAAKKMGIPLAHIEAGVRSGDRSQPEEINRILVDEMSTLLFIPDRRAYGEDMSTFAAKQTAYSRPSDICYSSCDLMLDAFLMYKDKAIKPDVDFPIEGKFNLLTLHRASLTKDFIKDVFRAVEFIGVPTVWPVHPRIGIELWDELMEQPSNLKVMQPASYFEMLWLVQNANHILTDSGGLVREAGFAGKPCTILRTESEWEGQVLRDYSALAILNSMIFTLKLPHRRDSKPMSTYWLNAHGNGKASETIVNAIFEYLEIKKDEPIQ